MSRGALAKLAITLCIPLPALYLRLAGAELRPTSAALVYGAAVVGAAVMLAWAAETAQLDISGSLAIALLALIAVLPEYAVDLYFAYTAGHEPEYAQYAAANMTGSNRLLIGLGWPLVALVAALGARHARRNGRPADSGTPLRPLWPPQDCLRRPSVGSGVGNNTADASYLRVKLRVLRCFQGHARGFHQRIAFGLATVWMILLS